MQKSVWIVNQPKYGDIPVIMKTSEANIQHLKKMINL